MENNKKKTLTIVLTVFAIVLVIGTTYAFVTRTLTGTKKVTLTAGTLSLVLDEKNAITISDALTLYNESDFKIKRKIDAGISNDYSVAKLTV